MVKEVFKDFKTHRYNNAIIDRCIGHVRYSTSGKSKKGQIEINDLQKEIQPYISDEFSLVYNGNISDISRANKKFGVKDITIDTEMIAEIIKKIDKKTFEEKLIEFVKNVNGVYCLIILTKTEMYVIRDSFGVRPLSVCETDKGYFISSETCAFDFPYKNLIEVKPGEILKICLLYTSPSPRD